MSISHNYNFGTVPKANLDYNKNYAKLRDVSNKFSMNGYGIYNQNNVTPTGKGNSNQSSINLNSSTRGTTTYDSKARSLNKNLSYRNSIDGIRQLTQGRFNLNGAVGIRKEEKSSPSVKVSRVIDITERDFNRLSTNSRKGPLANHVKESGVYKGKRYLVLDDVRYESKIANSDRLNKQNYKWMRR